MPVILVSDDEIVDLFKRKMVGQKYDKVVMELMKKGKFEIRRLGDMEVKNFEPFNLTKAYDDIKIKRAAKGVVGKKTKDSTVDVEEPIEG